MFQSVVARGNQRNEVYDKLVVDRRRLRCSEGHEGTLRVPGVAGRKLWRRKIDVVDEAFLKSIDCKRVVRFSNITFVSITPSPLNRSATLKSSAVATLASTIPPTTSFAARRSSSPIQLSRPFFALVDGMAR